MTSQDLKDWDTFRRQVKNGYHMSDSDWTEYIRLNHLVMEVCHDVHNKNMMGVLKQK